MLTTCFNLNEISFKPLKLTIIFSSQLILAIMSKYYNGVSHNLWRETQLIQLLCTTILYDSVNIQAYSRYSTSTKRYIFKTY